MYRITTYYTRFILSIVAVLFFTTKVQAQYNATPDSLDPQSLKLRICTHNFFRDNEYSAEKISGYTLPGFTLQPSLQYDCSKNILIEMGVHLLHFWGADQYPTEISNDVIPTFTENTSPLFRVKPLFRARLSFKDKFHLVLGSLYNNYYHYLPIPLYNRELSYATNPETGAQILVNLDHFRCDVWLDWQAFSFRNSNEKEQFVFGYSSEVKITNNPDNYTLNVPMYFLAEHQGGNLCKNLRQALRPITQLWDWLIVSIFGVSYNIFKYLVYWQVTPTRE